MRSAELAEATGLRPRPDHPQRQGLAASATWSTSTACSPARCDYPLHLGLTEAGHGRQGDRRLDGRAGDPAQRGDRRHDPGVADARARRAARARGRDRPAGPPVDRAALVPAAGVGLPGLRPDDVDVLPGDGPADPGLPQGPDAGLARDAPGRRGAARRGHGLRRQRPGRVASTPTSGSACPARSRSRSRRCSSTAASIARCVATGSSPSSSNPRGLRGAALPGPAAGRRAERPARAPTPGRRTAPIGRPRSRVYTSEPTERPLRDVGDPHVSF